MKRYLILGLLTASGLLAADESVALKERVTKLERDITTLREENMRLRESIATQERSYARKVYVESVVPMLKPMLKDFGMDESVLVPVEKIDTLADAYRPLLLTIQKIGELSTVTK